MTGPEHYRKAEHYLEHSKNHTDTGNEADRHIAELAAAQAQVHATLAQAAAIALGVVGGDALATVEGLHWRKAIFR
jgi:hypothetical protein